MLQTSNVLFRVFVLVTMAALCTATPVLAFRQFLDELLNGQQEIARRSGNQCSGVRAATNGQCSDYDGHATYGGGHCCPADYRLCRYTPNRHDYLNPGRGGDHWCCPRSCAYISHSDTTYGNGHYDVPGCSDDCYFNGPAPQGGDYDCPANYKCCDYPGHGDSRCYGNGCCCMHVFC